VSKKKITTLITKGERKGAGPAYGIQIGGASRKPKKSGGTRSGQKRETNAVSEEKERREFLKSRFGERPRMGTHFSLRRQQNHLQEIRERNEGHIFKNVPRRAEPPDGNQKTGNRTYGKSEGLKNEKGGERRQTKIPHLEKLSASNDVFRGEVRRNHEKR